MPVGTENSSDTSLQMQMQQNAAHRAIIEVLEEADDFGQDVFGLQQFLE